MEQALFPDEYFMKEALKEARLAFELEEVPVGAVVVSRDRIIARAHNMTQQLQDVTAHAEMIALTAASNFLGAKYLKGCTLFVTLEPCVMCAAAMKWAQLDRIVFGAGDEREGYSRIGPSVLHPKTVTVAGILEMESAQLLKDFFARRRPDGGQAG
jgi:tRNA(adenine34) deaminase